LPILPRNINNPIPQFNKDHLTNLNLNNFKIIETMVLQLMHRVPLERHYHRTEFHENLSGYTKVISGGHRDKLVI
jgi:hypothetical protein